MTNDKDSAVLEPCPVPWCGSPDAKALSFDANRRRHWIECGKCNFKTPQMPSRAKVITLWNTRQPTQSDALREENERLRALLARTVNLAEVYAEGTGTNFKEAMAEARAALQDQSK